MSPHDAAHDEVLFRAMVGDLLPGAPELERILESCSTCRSEWNDFQSVDRALAGAGGEMSRDLELARQSGGTPAEERFAAAIRARAAAQPPSRARRLARAAGFLAAAAALLLLVRHFLGGSSEAPLELLGRGLAIVSPAGTVERYGTFEFRGDLEQGGAFVLRIRDAALGAASEPILSSGRIAALSFTPAPDAEARLPAHILMQLDLYDANGVLRDSRTSEARLARR